LDQSPQIPTITPPIFNGETVTSLGFTRAYKKEFLSKRTCMVERLDPVFKKYNFDEGVQIKLDTEYTYCVGDADAVYNQMKLADQPLKQIEAEDHNLLMRAADLLEELLTSWGLEATIIAPDEIDINRAASAGYSYPNVKKGTWIDNGGMNKLPLFMEEYSKGGTPLWTVCAKSEYLKRTKVQAKNLRTFIFPTVEEYIVQAMFSTDFNDQLVNKSDGWVGLGTTFQYGGYGRLFRRLSRFPNYFKGDCTKYDKLIPASILSLIGKIRFKFMCNRDQQPRFSQKCVEWMKARGLKPETVILCYDVMYMNSVRTHVVLQNGHVFVMEQGIKSGFKNTSSDGTLAHILVILAFLISIYDRLGETLTRDELRRNVELSIYSDDHIGSVSDKLAPFFTYAERKGFYGRFGLQLKEEDDLVTQDIHELSFLGARPRTVGSGVVPVYNEERILSSLTYMNDDKIPPEIRYVKTLALYLLICCSEKEDFVQYVEKYLRYQYTTDIVKAIDDMPDNDLKEAVNIFLQGCLLPDRDTAMRIWKSDESSRNVLTRIYCNQSGRAVIPGVPRIKRAMQTPKSMRKVEMTDGGKRIYKIAEIPIKGYMDVFEYLALDGRLYPYTAEIDGDSDIKVETEHGFCDEIPNTSLIMEVAGYIWYDNASALDKDTYSKFEGSGRSTIMTGEIMRNISRDRTHVRQVAKAIGSIQPVEPTNGFIAHLQKMGIKPKTMYARQPNPAPALKPAPTVVQKETVVSKPMLMSMYTKEERRAHHAKMTEERIKNKHLKRKNQSGHLSVGDVEALKAIEHRHKKKERENTTKLEHALALLGSAETNLNVSMVRDIASEIMLTDETDRPLRRWAGDINTEATAIVKPEMDIDLYLPDTSQGNILPNPDGVVIIRKDAVNNVIYLDHNVNKDKMFYSVYVPDEIAYGNQSVPSKTPDLQIMGTRPLIMSYLLPILGYRPHGDMWFPMTTKRGASAIHLTNGSRVTINMTAKQAAMNLGYDAYVETGGESVAYFNGSAATASGATTTFTLTVIKSGYFSFDLYALNTSGGLGIVSLSMFVENYIGTGPGLEIMCHRTMAGFNTALLNINGVRVLGASGMVSNFTNEMVTSGTMAGAIIPSDKAWYDVIGARNASELLSYSKTKTISQVNDDNGMRGWIPAVDPDEYKMVHNVNTQNGQIFTVESKLYDEKNYLMMYFSNTGKTKQSLRIKSSLVLEYQSTNQWVETAKSTTTTQEWEVAHMIVRDCDYITANPIHWAALLQGILRGINKYAVPVAKKLETWSGYALGK